MAKPRPSQATLDLLRNRWDQRAAEDVMYYVKADRRDWTPEAFLASGEEDVRREVDPFLPALARPAPEAVALDVGCGLGRTSRALAARFARVVGIDVSPRMIAAARRFAPPVAGNVSYVLCDGSGDVPLAAETVDFVFSAIVFQHLPTRDIADRYLREIARVLTPGGLVRLQVNSHRRSWRRRLRVGIVASHKVPILHRKPRLKLDPHSPMGVVLAPAAWRRRVRRCGFVLEQMTGAGEQYTWLTLRQGHVPSIIGVLRSDC